MGAVDLGFFWRTCWATKPAYECRLMSPAQLGRIKTSSLGAENMARKLGSNERRSSGELPETETNIFAPENRRFASPIGKDRIPTIHFQGLCSGRVILRGSGYLVSG